nr:tRNA/rRNA methyltransferase (SpoU) family protein [Tanacetum cinerariifolium]
MQACCTLARDQYKSLETRRIIVPTAKSDGYWLKEVDLLLLLKTGQPCLAKRSYNLRRVQISFIRFTLACNILSLFTESGLKRVYTSRTIDGSSTFLEQYTVCLSERNLPVYQGTDDISEQSCISYKTYSFGRARLMSLAGCVAAAASGISKPAKNEAEKYDEASRKMKSDIGSTYYNDKAALLDVFRFIIERSKQHFNPNYRLKG